MSRAPEAQREALLDLARRLRPCRRDLSRFHDERDEVEHALAPCVVAALAVDRGAAEPSAGQALEALALGALATAAAEALMAAGLPGDMPAKLLAATAMARADSMASRRRQPSAGPVRRSRPCGGGSISEPFARRPPSVLH